MALGRKKQSTETAAPEPSPAPTAKSKPTYRPTHEVGEDFLTPPQDGLRPSEGGTAIADLPEAEVDGGSEDPEQDFLDDLRDLADGDEPEGEGDEEEDGKPSGPEPLEFTDDQLDRPVKLKVDGEDVEMPLRDVLANGMRQADYTRKTMELATERRELSRTRDEASTLAESLAQRLEVFGNVLASRGLGTQEQQVLASAYQQARQEQAALAAANLHDHIESEHKALKEALEWKNEGDVKKGQTELAKAAVELYGFEPNDLLNVSDHRILLVLSDAAKYHEVVARQEEARGTLQAKRKKSPSLSPGVKHAPGGDAPEKKTVRDARSRFQRSGTASDAADLIALIQD